MQTQQQKLSGFLTKTSLTGSENDLLSQKRQEKQDMFNLFRRFLLTDFGNISIQRMRLTSRWPCGLQGQKITFLLSIESLACDFVCGQVCVCAVVYAFVCLFVDLDCDLLQFFVSIYIYIICHAVMSLFFSRSYCCQTDYPTRSGHYFRRLATLFQRGDRPTCYW